VSSKTTPSKNKNTGLGQGVQAFFGGGGGGDAKEDSATPQTSEQSPAPVKPVREKSRTTVILYNDTLEAIELLKAQSRKKGVKASMSDILNDAVELLVQERNKQSA
jgi:hypothetical protein